MKTKIESTKTPSQKKHMHLMLIGEPGFFFRQNLEIPRKQMIEYTILDRLIVLFIQVSFIESVCLEVLLP